MKGRKQSMVQLAKSVAERAHAGQVDKAGRPYIAHPARVAARVAGDASLEAVAWLHDVVEDTEVTLADLADMFPSDVVAAVDAMTRRRGEEPRAYYQRVRLNPLALAVKQADIDDNTDPVRVARLDAATRERLAAKYASAREALAGV